MATYTCAFVILLWSSDSSRGEESKSVLTSRNQQLRPLIFDHLFATETVLKLLACTSCVFLFLTIRRNYNNKIILIYFNNFYNLVCQNGGPEGLTQPLDLTNLSNCWLVHIMLDGASLCALLFLPIALEKHKSGLTRPIKF